MYHPEAAREARCLSSCMAAFKVDSMVPVVASEKGANQNNSLLLINRNSLIVFKYDVQLVHCLQISWSIPGNDELCKVLLKRST